MGPAVTEGLARRVSDAVANEASGRVVGRWLVGAGALAAVFVVLHVTAVDTLSLTRDPSTTTGVGPEVGVLSTLGLILWGSSTAVLALAATLVQSSADILFLCCTAGAIGVLLVDDALLLHEKVLPDAGVPQDVVYVVYLAGALAWAIAFRREIGAGMTLLVLAAVCFAASIALDVLDARQDAEDYAKLVGIATVFAWAFDQARRRLQGALTCPPSWLPDQRQPLDEHVVAHRRFESRRATQRPSAR
jgi:hypothetical protein